MILFQLKRFYSNILEQVPKSTKKWKKSKKSVGMGNNSMKI